MAFTNFFQSSSKAHDDHHHQHHHDESRPDSPAPPSGISTPNPDPTDKRLPGIFASYFGQVGASLHPSTLPASKMLSHKSESDSALWVKLGGGDLPTAPSSPTASEPPNLLPHERIDSPPPLKNPKHVYSHGYPTPPASSSSSSLSRASNREEQDAVPISVADCSVGAEPLRRKHSLLDCLPSSLRRSTLSANPLTNITTTPTVHASHFSSPGLRVSHSNPASPVVARNCASIPPAGSLPSCEHQGLTQDVKPSRNQSTPTPPRTPRTLSHNTLSRGTSPASRSTSHADGQPSKRKKARSNSALLGDPKGKLSISITEGRGLKPSVDPYVVCQFQWNEYISKGPRSDRGSGTSDDVMDGALGSVAIRRTDSDMGRPMAIPMRSRQSSHASHASHASTSSRDSSKGKEVTDPVWNHEAVFDVVGDQNEVDISIYDRSVSETFLGHIRFCPVLKEGDAPLDNWFKLEARDLDEQVCGEVRLRVKFQGVEKRHFGPEDFQILKLIGKGTFGQVFQVRKRDTQRVYAMKVLSKKVIVQKKEVAHTLGERNILVRTAMTESPFIVGLKFSFQTPSDLYLVTDYMSGGELFWHLQKEGRFHEHRAKFYIAELILALQHLHQHDIVYRDLKPENILLDANGHIALCDFGLSKANLTKDETTNTFCGTTEYLAPEVLLDEAGYTKMVDYWSLGVLVFEMCCGWSPFYAEDTQQMYKNIAFGKVRFPRDALSIEGRNFVKGLLNRNPKHRLGANNDAEELKAHPFFNDIDWIALAKKNVVPPFKPRLKSELDTSNFDPEFTNALNGASSLNARAAALASGIDTASTPLSPTMQANFKGFTFVDESSLEKQFQDRDTMDEEKDDWAPLSPKVSRDNRMSGIQTGGADEGMFNAEGFDVD